MKVSVENIFGQLVKKDDRYEVFDNNFLNYLKLSKTILNKNKNTTGHSHIGQEEIYLFTKGTAKMQRDDDIIDVSEGDIVLIPDGVFHKVFAGTKGCEFISIFNGNRNH